MVITYHYFCVGTTATKYTKNIIKSKDVIFLPFIKPIWQD